MRGRPPKQGEAGDKRTRNLNPILGTSLWIPTTLNPDGRFWDAPQGLLRQAQDRASSGVGNGANYTRPVVVLLVIIIFAAMLIAMVLQDSERKGRIYDPEHGEWVQRAESASGRQPVWDQGSSAGRSREGGASGRHPVSTGFWMGLGCLGAVLLVLMLLAFCGSLLEG